MVFWWVETMVVGLDGRLGFEMVGQKVEKLADEKVAL